MRGDPLSDPYSLGWREYKQIPRRERQTEKQEQMRGWRLWSPTLAAWCAARMGHPASSKQPKKASASQWRFEGLFSGCWLAEVGVVAVDPVLAGWVEDVEVYCVFEGEGFVGDIGWDAEDVA